MPNINAVLTWVPSNKAMKAGLVPTDYDQYDINVYDYLSPELVQAIESEAPAILKSVFVAATRTVRHAYNNEVASSWLTSITDKETGKPDPEKEKDVELRKNYLHEKRTEWRQNFIQGELGMRLVSVTPPEDELTTEAKGIAFAQVKDHVLKSGGEFPYTVINARSLAKEYGGKTVAQWIDDLLNRELAPKRAGRIWDEAQKIIDTRNAAKAAAAPEDDEDDPMSAMFDSEAEAAE